MDTKPSTDKKNSLFAEAQTYVHMRFDAYVCALIRACAFAKDIISYCDGWISDFLLFTVHAVAYTTRAHTVTCQSVFDYQLSVCGGGQKNHISTEYFN